VFPGPAFDYDGQTDHQPGAGKLREMANFSIHYNGGKDASSPNIEKWNEIVIDETLMLPAIREDPALVIPAFVYAKSSMPISKANAQRMRDEFCAFNKVADIPLVEIDDTQYRPDGPFTLPSDESVTTTARKLRGARAQGHLEVGGVV